MARPGDGPADLNWRVGVEAKLIFLAADHNRLVLLPGRDSAGLAAERMTPRTPASRDGQAVLSSRRTGSCSSGSALPARADRRYLAMELRLGRPGVDAAHRTVPVVGLVRPDGPGWPAALRRAASGGAVVSQSHSSVSCAGPTGSFWWLLSKITQTVPWGALAISPCNGVAAAVVPHPLGHACSRGVDVHC